MDRCVGENYLEAASGGGGFVPTWTDDMMWGLVSVSSGRGWGGGCHITDQPHQNCSRP